MLSCQWFVHSLDGDLSRTTRKSRSQSLSASFRNLFRRARRPGGSGAGGDVSRESSVSRGGGAVGTSTLRDNSATPSPQLSTSSWGQDLRLRTPDYTPRSYQSYAAGGLCGGTPVLQTRPSPSSLYQH